MLARIGLKLDNISPKSLHARSNSPDFIPLAALKVGRLLFVVSWNVLPQSLFSWRPELRQSTHGTYETPIGRVWYDLGYSEDPLKEVVKIVVPAHDRHWQRSGCLLLTPVNDRLGVFRCVGSFFLDLPWFDDSKEQTITIIWPDGSHLMLVNFESQK